MKVNLNINLWLSLLLFSILILVIEKPAFSQGVVVTEETGTVTPHSSSILDVRSTTKGLLIPRMTSAQRTSIASPTNGLLVYDLTENQFYYYNSSTTSWVMAVGPQGPQGFLDPGSAIGVTPYWNGSQWVVNNINLFHDGNRVGIGTNNPLGRLDVRLLDGADYINVQRNVAGFGPIIDFFGYSNTHRLRLEYLNTSVYNFQTDGTGRHISFNPSGNFGIGIGTDAPTQKLDVGGNARLRGHLFDFNNSSGTAGQVLSRGASGIVWAAPAGNVNGTGTAGRIAYWSGASNIAALPLMNYNTTNQFVEITSKTVANDDDPIFEVRNKNGLVVLGVYQTGVRVYVDDSGTKTGRGGFAVGGFTSQKDEKALSEYLRVTPDSTRVYVNTASSKTGRGGFAVGGFTTQKGEKALDDFMYMTADNYFIGHQSGVSTIPGTGVSGRYNTFFGYNSGNKNKYGHSNVFIGNKSGFNTLGHLTLLDQGSRNVFLGFEAGFSNTTGYDNVYIGYNTGRGGTTTQRNVMVGKDAGHSATGNDNIIIGTGSGYSNSGANNIFLGNNAGRVNTGAENIIIGKDAAFLKTQGNRGVFIGNNAGYYQEINNNSVFIGDFAGYGYDDGNPLTYPSTNICIGPSSGYLLGHSSSYNVFIGYEAGYNIKTNNSGNILLGAWAGKSIGKTNTTDSYNVIIGYQKAISVEGWNNVFIGNGTYTTTTRNISNSVHIGNLAGDQETTSGKLYIANSNTTTPLIYGDFSAAALRIHGSLTFNTGANSIQMPTTRGTTGQALTTNAATGVASWTTITSEATTASNGLNLSTRDVRLGGTLTQNTTITQAAYNMTFNLSGTGDFDIQDNGVSAFFVRDDGNVGVGTNAPSYKLHVVGSSYFDVATYKIVFEGSGNEPVIRSTLANYGFLGTSANYWYQTYTNSIYRNNEYALSDSNAKTNIKPISSALDKVLALKGYSYNYDKNHHPFLKNTRNNEDEFVNLGFIAQELMQVVPEMVVFDKETGLYMIRNYEQLLPVMVEAIKEQQQTIEELKAKSIEIDNLKAELEQIKKMLGN